ncbi:hyaluronoglucosaminidase [Clostridium sp. B9]|uniref:hyaluronoglucosaminidase n=1 Tax=Clostridium sp. B9 TaxID=3423224 RepID=UPI003D2EEAC5
MKKHIQKIVASTVLAAMTISALPCNLVVFATDGTSENVYEIYPKPQDINYKGGGFQLSDEINIVYDEGIDIYTKNRVNEVLESKNLEATVSNEIVQGKTNFLVGINESGGFVDTYFNENVPHEETFFDENMDSHIVSVNDGVIGVIGEDPDSAFYGVTTLKHVFNQVEEDNMIQNFRVDDYAEVAHRGFIEGYYGNPWSNEDRAELMKFGGDYKLNQYVFAPKDDPYHNSKWRELYPEEKLSEIKKLAQVGNETKNRYVYALHPFMHSPVRFDTEENYQADLQVIKEKFTQLLENDVRQFAILADDAAAPAQGASMYVKLLTDLTRWLEEQQNTYPDLKTDLMFCPSDYYGNGSSQQLKELNKAEENVSIVMTGGRIWGEVDENFADNFMNNIATEGNPGRAPFYWINWPCSDNSKQHLIMGGNDTFLHPGVDPSKIDGIVLNPMQQAEANKSALFAVADYAWNVWDNKEQADENWHDSFKYMDHGTAEDTNSSLALREISKHMINQNMDGRVRPLQESIELAPKLDAFKQKYDAGLSIKAEALDLIEEFTNLQKAADYYKNNPGNERTRDQIIYWLNCWEDTTNAVISYLKSAIAVEEGDDDAAWANYSAGQTAFEKSKTYGFHYVNHTEYAEVGVQHIVPFIKHMGENLASVVGSIIDPNKVYATYITNREDTPSGNKDNIFDGNAGTELVYKNPTSIAVGTYVGIKYSNPIKLNSVEFLMGANSNLNDTMQKAKIQYTVDGKEWVDLEGGKEYSMPREVKVEGLDLEVKGIRLIATEARSNTWLGVRDINVNKKDDSNSGVEFNPTLIRSSAWKVYEGSESSLLDGDEDTGVWYKTANGDTSLAGEFIGLDLGKEINLDGVRFVIGKSGGGASDKWNKFKLEYSLDNETWTTIKEYDRTGAPAGKDVIEEDFETPIAAKYVRLTNMENVHKWVTFSEFAIKSNELENAGNKDNIYTNTSADLLSRAEEDKTILLPLNDITLNNGEYIGVKLDRIKDLSSLNIELSDNTGLTLQSSANGVEWVDITDTSTLEDGRYVRAINNGNDAVTFNLTKFEVNSTEVYEPSLVEAYVGDDGSKKAVDGNLKTSVKFLGAPNTGDSIVYDLGQDILVDNLKYVVLDTEVDHVRDGKIQLSLDGENWTDAITIGDGIENGVDDIYAKPLENGYIHGNQSGGVVPIDSAYVEGTNLNKKARYVRIVFTAPYRHRWTVINELMINNGAYIPTVNDPTYISNPIEEKGFAPSNLRDGDLTTSYKPNTNNGEITEGSLTYKLSEKTDVRKVTIVQDGSSISSAIVKVRIGADEWVELGTLSNSLNEFINRDYENIFEIKIEWNGIAPNIYEIITLNDEFEFPVNDSLQAKYDELVSLNGDEYTVSSFASLEEALENAKAILDDSNASQKKIDKALEKLTEAEEGLALRASDFAKFDEVLALGNSLVAEDYTPESWTVFEEKLAIANEANGNKADYTQEQVNTIVTELETAINDLVEVVPEVDKGALETLVNDGKALVEAAVEGMNVGEYHEGAKSLLSSEIDKAEAVIANSDATQDEVDSAKSELTNVIERFNSLLITETTGDFNNSGKIDIGDLAMVSKNFGSNDENLDLNKDGVVDEYEIRFINHRILN